MSGIWPKLGRLSEIRPISGQDRVAQSLEYCARSLFRIRVPVPTASVPTAVPTFSRCDRSGRDHTHERLDACALRASIHSSDGRNGAASPSLMGSMLVVPVIPSTWGFAPVAGTCHRAVLRRAPILSARSATAARWSSKRSKCFGKIDRLLSLSTSDRCSRYGLRRSSERPRLSTSRSPGHLRTATTRSHRNARRSAENCARTECSRGLADCQSGVVA